MRAVTVPLEVCHAGTDGVLHGHSLTVEVWTAAAVDLDVFRAEVAASVAFMEHGLLEDSCGRTFEDVGAAVLQACPEAARVVVRLPTRGHVVEVVSQPKSSGD